jgi:predicted lipoprotein with Yx(FWY)xxD motif
MKALFLGIGALAAVLSLTVGLSSGLAANHSAGAGGVKVGVASSGLGRVLVDGRGRTLYLFEKDKHGKSACAGQCAGFWPPLIARGKPLATAGAKASLLGTTKRADGRLQVTYNHHPLYTFVKDTSKGQTNGEGVGAFGG